MTHNVELLLSQLSSVRCPGRSVLPCHDSPKTSSAGQARVARQRHSSTPAVPTTRQRETGLAASRPARLNARSDGIARASASSIRANSSGTMLGAKHPELPSVSQDRKQPASPKTVSIPSTAVEVRSQKAAPLQPIHKSLRRLSPEVHSLESSGESLLSGESSATKLTAGSISSFAGLAGRALLVVASVASHAPPSIMDNLRDMFEKSSSTALLAQFGFAALEEWLVLSCVCMASSRWFEQGKLWQAACSLSAWREVSEQSANDLACISAPSLKSIVCKMLRAAKARSWHDRLITPTFPACSNLRLVQHGCLWTLQQGTTMQDGHRNRTCLGAKLWGACELFCAHLLQPRSNWAAGVAESLTPGSRVLELGAGMGLLGVAVLHACEPARVLATDGDPSCMTLISITAALNPPKSTAPLMAPSAQKQEKAHATAVLRWGEPVDSTLARSFDVVVASDVAYSLELVEPLWRTVAAVLAPRGAFLVGHVDRTPSASARLLELARKHGFKLKHRHDLYAIQDPPQMRAHACPAILFVFTRSAQMKPVKVGSNASFPETFF